MPLGLGGWELLVLVGVIVLLFGAKRLPEIGRQLGGGMRDLRRAVEDVDPREDLKQALEPAPAPPARAPQPED